MKYFKLRLSYEVTQKLRETWKTHERDPAEETWATKMKIECSRQVKTREMDKRMKIVTPWAPDRAQNTNY